jgi:hypothetical protein
LLAGGLVAPVGADTAPVSEHAVKAVLFYKLPQFVYLPSGARGRAAGLCGLGDHPVIEALEKLPQTATEGRGATYQSVDGINAGLRCDFLFIARDEAGNLDTLLHRLRDTSVVTVSDIPGFARAGGMVELAPNPERAGVLILINRKAAQRQGIEFNAQLLRLARIVEP